MSRYNIGQDDVDRLFDVDQIDRLAAIAKIPNKEIEAFGRAIRRAVREYLDEAGALSPKEIRDAISELGAAVYEEPT